MHFTPPSQKIKKLSNLFLIQQNKGKAYRGLYDVCKYIICFSTSLGGYLSVVVSLPTKIQKELLHTVEGSPVFWRPAVGFVLNLLVLYFTVCWMLHTVLAVFLRFVWLLFLYLLITWKEKLSFSQPKTSC